MKQWLKNWLGITALEEKVATLHPPVEPPVPDEWDVPQWAIDKYNDPHLTTMEYGIAWAKFVKGDGDVTQLRLPYYKGPNDEKLEDPYMEPPPVSSGLRVPLADGAKFLAYRKAFKGTNGAFVELCDPAGYAIDLKWVEWLGESSTGR